MAGGGINGVVPSASDFSGTAVSLIGTANIVNVSGNLIRIQGFDPSGQTYNDLIVNQSGGNVLRVDAGAINVASNVSGNVVYLVSGQNNVQMSGQVVLISGQTVVASVTTNISGQTVYLASGQNAVQNSGQSIYLVSGKNIVQIGDGQDGTANLALVVGAVDNQGTGDFSLSTFDHLYAYNKELNTWPSLSVTASGHAISGLVHKLIVGFSGETATISGNAVAISGQAVLISGQTVVASVTTNISGQTVYLASGKNQVQNSGETITISDGNNVPLFNIGGEGHNAGERRVDVNSQLYGYEGSIQQDWRRLRATTSGGQISGVPHALVVTAAIYDLSGATMRSMVSPSSGSNALLTATATPPTYSVYADNVVPASGGVAFAMQYRSGGSTIVLKKMFITNIEPTLISGQYLRFDVCRISGLFSGGTALTALPHDPLDATSGASLNIAQAVVGSLFPAAARNLMFSWNTVTRGVISGAAIAPALLQQGFNILPESPEMKEIRMTSGFGIMLQQTLAQTGYTQVTSGRFGINVVYTIQ